VELRAETAARGGNGGAPDSMGAPWRKCTKGSSTPGNSENRGARDVFGVRVRISEMVGPATFPNTVGPAKLNSEKLGKWCGSTMVGAKLSEKGGARDSENVGGRELQLLKSPKWWGPRPRKRWSPRTSTPANFVRVGCLFAVDGPTVSKARTENCGGLPSAGGFKVALL